MVVETVQHDQQNTASRRERLQTTLREGIGLELSVLVGSDQILLLLNITVQNGKVQVGRGLVQVLLPVVGLEDVYGKVSYCTNCLYGMDARSPWMIKEAQSKKTLDTLLG